MKNPITLKNIKYAAFNSEETHCYSASVYFKGKRVGTVKNDGHGGADYQYVEDKEGWAAMEAYICTLDAVTTTCGGNSAYSYIQDLETICGDLVNDWLVTKDLKRALSKKVLFQKSGNAAVFETKSAPNKATLEHWIEQIGERADTSAILNRIPFDSALNIYRAIG